MEKISYNPTLVCSRKMEIEVDNNIICSVNIVGGCPGNTLGVSKLCVGKTIDDVIETLEGIDCRGRGTSCPDQLAIALKNFRNSKEEAS